MLLLLLLPLLASAAKKAEIIYSPGKERSVCVLLEEEGKRGRMFPGDSSSRDTSGILGTNSRGLKFPSLAISPSYSFQKGWNLLDISPLPQTRTQCVGGGGGLSVCVKNGKGMGGAGAKFLKLGFGTSLARRQGEGETWQRAMNRKRGGERKTLNLLLCGGLATNIRTGNGGDVEIVQMVILLASYQEAFGRQAMKKIRIHTRGSEMEGRTPLYSRKMIQLHVCVYRPNIRKSFFLPTLDFPPNFVA